MHVPPLLPKLLALLVFLLASTSAISEDGAEDRAEDRSDVRATTYTIAVLAFRDTEATQAQWQPTADYLSQQIASADFRIQALDYPSLDRAVRSGNVDFVLTNTGHYVRLEAERGITRLTTLIARAQGEPIREFGGAILVPAERNDLQHLADLRGQRMLAVQEDSLGGWLAGAHALGEAGLDPFRDLAAVEFTGMPHRTVIDRLLAGEADAGMVRTGVFEALKSEGVLEPGALRVLAPRDQAGFPFVHSTRLYPEWPFARLEHTPDAIAEAVTIALLSMTPGEPAAHDGGYHGWSAPLSYGSMHSLLETLGRPPYDRPAIVELRTLWETYPEILFAALAGLLLLTALALLHYRRLNQRLQLEVVQRRSAESRLRAHEVDLAYQAEHDPLTGLPNRLLLVEQLTEAMDHAARTCSRVAVLFVNLDRFKTINDSLGHAVGDDLLQILGERLKAHFDARLVARIGGDEFIAVLDDADERPRIEGRARQLLQLIAEPFAVGGWRDLQVGASIGIALFPDHATTAGELITQADAAMYEAKDAGRNTFRFYTRALTDAANQRLEIENRLRRAIANRELEVFYQPQLETNTGRITGVEALVRWRDPERGLIPPAVFIPVAEETGLIATLGAQVLRKACRQAVAWDREGLPPLAMSVNLSTRQIADPGLLHRIRQVLQESSLPPHRLTLEITESTLMQHAGTARDTLQQIKRLGVALAIDDFGTGYSSLAYLKEFAIDTLKIDRTFVRDLPADRSDAELTMTIIDMAHNLGLDVLAEGVETESQLEFLAAHGCDAWQGYLCSQPVPAEELAARLRQPADTPAAHARAASEKSGA
ncbi:bifunctional diguanylate cyclase/phosphodiesterase [Thioalkalivibrio sp. ALJ16]|uniref:putative bifunctional diguanylate cyclase/phosphodiesterase n=1 Tax=Thioalkalivibrio sp. ALJ16 TaxID=1158762 RepID=UPI00035C2BE2|nr:EAL domain-containing protein [Thioalkalivibrio sp. ALJ16]